MGDTPIFSQIPGSRRIKADSQEVTVAAGAISGRKPFGHLSSPAATRRQSVSLPDTISTRLCRLYRRLSYVTVVLRCSRPGIGRCGREPVNAIGPRYRANTSGSAGPAFCRVADPKTVQRQHAPDKREIRKAMQEIATVRRRFGYRRIGLLLERRGMLVNAKKL